MERIRGKSIQLPRLNLQQRSRKEKKGKIIKKKEQNAKKGQKVWSMGVGVEKKRETPFLFRFSKFFFSSTFEDYIAKSKTTRRVSPLQIRLSKSKS